MSTYLRENAVPGTPVEFIGPAGGFYLRDVERPYRTTFERGCAAAARRGSPIIAVAVCHCHLSVLGA
jgi:hypothetical protein